MVIERRVKMITENIRCDCQGCTERVVGCHATCEKYKDFLLRNEKLKEKRKIDLFTSDSNSNGWIYARRRRDK